MMKRLTVLTTFLLASTAAIGVIGEHPDLVTNVVRNSVRTASAAPNDALTVNEGMNVGSLPAQGAEGGNWPARPRAAFFDNFKDVASSPRTIHLGGLQDHADAYVNLLGMEMGHSDNSGAILTVQDANTSFYSNRNGAGLTDGVLEFTKTNNNAPRLEAGSDIANPDGKKRAVTFTKTGFSVSPAFDAYQMSLIQGAGRIRVYTNWKNGNNNPPVRNGLAHPNEYFAYLDADSAVTSGSGDSSVTTFNVMTDDDSGAPGWRTENSPDAVSAPPGRNPGDTIDNTSDTTSHAPGLVWHYSHPAVFIGMADHKFIHNDMAQFIPGNDSISREMTGVEYDLLAVQNKDYQYKISGITVNASGNGHKLTEDSVDMVLAGVIPHHLEIWDSCETQAIETSGFVVPGACNTRTPNSGYVMGQFNGRSYNGHRISLSFANLVRSNPSVDWTSNVPALIASIDGDGNNPLSAGSGQGGIKWNQDGDAGSVSLCGGEFAKNCGLTVSGTGTVKTTALVVPFGTPSSSSTPCERGQIEVDDRYTYTCVARNKWHRASNGSSW
ncbi:hypothetical protein [Acetobacter fallax]|uniref:Secreted protein n=1 Tax=Acetobacter fallax TaxID=1737473 RepID=A0ABX0KA79_9PROT|nr:hypothetical protein [Acetobacter fallax]NHO32121.1 hypothetical protein [Acetobacter fallax]NHO35608.1 hypothetical protein [Acetobacter fallax]